jgi:hypothetical protein
MRDPRFQELDQLIAAGQGDEPTATIRLRPSLEDYAAKMRAHKTANTKVAHALQGWQAARRIMRVIAQQYQLKSTQLEKDGRDGGRYPLVVKARAEAMKSIRENLGYSLPLIGRIFGGYHHTSVMYLIAKAGQVNREKPLAKAGQVNCENRPPMSVRVKDLEERIAALEALLAERNAASQDVSMRHKAPAREAGEMQARRAAS